MVSLETAWDLLIFPISLISEVLISYWLKYSAMQATKTYNLQNSHNQISEVKNTWQQKTSTQSKSGMRSTTEVWSLGDLLFTLPN